MNLPAYLVYIVVLQQQICAQCKFILSLARDSYIELPSNPGTTPSGFFDSQRSI